jgi:HK97 family phage portal protein
MQLSRRLSKALPISNIPASRQGLPALSIVNGLVTSISDNKANYIDKAYAINDMVYSAVNLVLDKVRMPAWGVYKVVDEQSLKQLYAMYRRKDLSGMDGKKMFDLWRKAVEPIKDGTKLHELLKWPNEKETFNDFFANGVGNLILTGDKFIWGLLLKEGANAGLPQELHNLPTQGTSIIASRTFPVRELGYMLDAWQIPLSKESVLHEKKWNPKLQGLFQDLYGMAPFGSGLQVINASNSGDRAAAASFQNQGPPGVLSVDDNRWTADESIAQANAVKEILYYEHMGPDMINKLATSGYKMHYTPIGTSPVDLAINAFQMQALRRICNVIGVPSQLLNDPDNKTYANQKEGERALTSRCAMPYLISGRENINRKIQTDWGFRGKNIIVDFDPTCFTELQQDAKEVAEWTSQMIAISPNEQRNMLGMDAVEGDEMDEVWISRTGRQPLSDFLETATQNALNDQGREEDI